MISAASASTRFWVSYDLVRELCRHCELDDISRLGRCSRQLQDLVASSLYSRVRINLAVFSTKDPRAALLLARPLAINALLIKELVLNTILPVWRDAICVGNGETKVFDIIRILLPTMLNLRTFKVFGDADLPETFIDSLGTLARLKCLRIPNLPMPSPVIQPPSPFPSLSSLQVTKMTCKYGRGFAFCQTTLTDLTLSFLPGVQVRSELMEGFTNLRCLRISGGDFVDEPKTKRRILLSVSSLKLSGCSNLGWLWRAFGERLDKVVLHSMATDGIVKFLSALDVGFGDLRLSLLNEPLLCDSIVYAIMSRSPTSSGKPVLAV